jgi:hypothetical protein
MLQIFLRTLVEKYSDRKLYIPCTV